MKHAGAVVWALLALSGCKRERAVPAVTSEITANTQVVAQEVAPVVHDAGAPWDASQSPPTAQVVEPSPTPPSRPVATTGYRTSGGIEFAELNESALQSMPASQRNAAPAHTFAAVSERSGRAPTMGSVLAALRTQVASSASFVAQGGFSALGEGRYVAVVMQTDPAYPRSPRLAVVTVSENAAAPQIEGLAYVPTENVWQARDSNGCTLTVNGRQVRDLDQDGEKELSLAITFCSQPTCPTGFVTYGYLAVFDLTPTPRLVAMVERSVVPQAPETLTSRGRTTRWRDVNGDGHADLIVSGEDCEPQVGEDPESLVSRGCTRAREAEGGDVGGPWCCLSRTETVLYDPATDAWREGRRSATQVTEIPCEGGSEESD
ncbi:MAG: hypothetical protein Q8Q09_00330 [Deltaproteobacteria bacterium]|nr:hypothetical protein [Deltaproteobacteria bacterium]